MLSIQKWYVIVGRGVYTLIALSKVKLSSRKIYTNLTLWFIDLNQFSKEHLQELKDYKNEWVIFLNPLLIWLEKGG